MQIASIDRWETFQNIRKNWDAVYAADPDAHFFLSSVWLSGWLRRISEPWFILAAKPDPQESDPKDSFYVAFFPLKLVLIDREDGTFSTHLYMAGNSIADYTGILCMPGYEGEAISAFADYIQKQVSWTSFDLQNTFRDDAKILQLLKRFPHGVFKFTQHSLQNVGEKTDQYLAPYLELPGDWEDYLNHSIRSNTRQKIRRYLKKVESSETFSISYTDADRQESDIEILLQLWLSQWQGVKGEACDDIVQYLRYILQHCFDKDCLYLSILWQGEKPLAAIANFLDRPKQSMLFVISGRDETCQNIPPGLILHADAIRYAIQKGFQVYDFLRGNEDYKYSLGAKERSIWHIRATYKQLKSRTLDQRLLPLAYHLTVQHHRANRLERAERGYRQILETQSDYPDALYGLGVLMRQKGDYQTAETLLQNLLQIQPNSINALFSLGNLYLELERFHQAIAAYERIVALQSARSATYNNLGYALQQLGKWEEAIACYQKALELQPNCIEADVNQANALHARGKLPPDRYVQYAMLNYDLGKKCQQMGDLTNAKVYYTKCLCLKSDFPEAQENLEWIVKQHMATHSEANFPEKVPINP